MFLRNVHAAVCHSKVKHGFSREKTGLSSKKRFFDSKNVFCQAFFFNSTREIKWKGKYIIRSVAKDREVIL